MKRLAFLAFFSILVFSCAEYKETSYFGRDDSGYTVEVSDSTVQLTYVVGCLGGNYKLHHFSWFNDSKLIFTDSKPLLNDHGFISLSDFCLIDNDTVYCYDDSLRLSVSGKCSTFELSWVEKEKIKKNR